MSRDRARCPSEVAQESGPVVASSLGGSRLGAKHLARIDLLPYVLFKLTLGHLRAQKNILLLLLLLQVR